MSWGDNAIPEGTWVRHRNHGFYGWVHSGDEWVTKLRIPEIEGSVSGRPMRVDTCDLEVCEDQMHLDDIDTLIDLALATWDKKWFKQLMTAKRRLAKASGLGVRA